MFTVHTVPISHVATQIYIVIIKNLLLLFTPGVSKRQSAGHMSRTEICNSSPCSLDQAICLKTQHTFLHTQQFDESFFWDVFGLFPCSSQLHIYIQNVHYNHSLNITKHNPVTVTHTHTHTHTQYITNTWQLLNPSPNHRQISTAFGCQSLCTVRCQHSVTDCTM
jgi:hypothetical protein